MPFVPYDAAAPFSYIELLGPTARLCRFRESPDTVTWLGAAVFIASGIVARTHGGVDYNRTLARLAEDNGFEYALSQVRYMASYGAEYQHESTGFSLALRQLGCLPFGAAEARRAAPRRNLARSMRE